MTPRPSAEGDLLRHAVRSLLTHLGDDTPRAVTRHLLGLANDLDGREMGTPRAILAGRWVRRQRGNAGPGVAGIAHVAANLSRSLSDAIAVCGKQLRGNLDWAAPARPGNHADGWRPCRSCVSAISAVAPLRRSA